MPKVYILVALLGFTLLSACNTTKTSVAPQPNDTVAGFLTVHIDGVGSEVLNSHAEFTPALSAQQFQQDSTFDGSNFVLKNVETFLVNGQRYVNVLYGFTNGDSVRRITLVAVDTDGDGSGLSNVELYDGSPASGDTGLALGTAQIYDYVSESLRIHPADGYLRIDPSQIVTTTDPAPVLLADAFQTWDSALGSNIIEANSDAKVLFSSAFDASGSSTQHPFSFNINFIVTAEEVSVVSVDGELTTDDSTDQDFSFSTYYIDYFDLTELTAGEPVSLKLNPTGGFTSVLAVYDKDARIANGGTGGKIASTFDEELTFTAQDGVNYLVGVSTLSSRQTGTYTLTSYAGNLAPFDLVIP